MQITSPLILFVIVFVNFFFTSDTLFVSFKILIILNKIIKIIKTPGSSVLTPSSFGFVF